ncbi:MAG: hypothetical protein R3F46_02615 [bacterium]
MQMMLNKVSSKGQSEPAKRAHGYSGTGSLVNTTMKQWYDGDTEPAGDSLEHIYDRGRMLQNYDGSSTYGDQWRWAGAQNAHNSPLHSPNADTASQTGYNLANDKTPQRRTFLSPTSEGDQRNLYGQGKPQAKDSSGSGANWYVGTTSQPQTAQMGSMESRLFFEGTVTATDMDRATDTREKGRIGITGSAQAYGGSNGRVTSEAIGRDINPLGRGGGAALVGGMLNFGGLAPGLPGGQREVNQGNSVNNACVGCDKLGSPHQDPGNGGFGAAPISNQLNDPVRQCCSCFASITYSDARALTPPVTYLRESCCPKICSNDEVDCVDHGNVVHTWPNYAPVYTCDLQNCKPCENIYQHGLSPGLTNAISLASACLKNKIELVKCAIGATNTNPNYSQTAKQIIHDYLYGEIHFLEKLNSKMFTIKWETDSTKKCKWFGHKCAPGIAAVACKNDNVIIICPDFYNVSGTPYIDLLCWQSHAIIHEVMHKIRFVDVEFPWLDMSKNVQDQLAKHVMHCCGCQDNIMNNRYNWPPGVMP